LFNKVLAGFRQLTGENHPEILRILDRLSDIYEDLYNFNEAEKHKRKELTLRQSIFGDENISTLQTARELGQLLNKQNTEDKNREAEEILRQKVAKMEVILGKVDKDTLSSAAALGRALYNQKKYQEAELWYRLVLAGREETLGDSHESTLSIRADLEEVLFDQEKWEEMAESCRHSLALRRKLGPECYDTLRIAGGLALALQKMGKDEGMELLHEIVLKAQVCYTTYMGQGNHEEAILAKEGEWEGKVLLYGRQDPETMKVQRELALAYEETGKHGDAEETFRDLLTSMEAKL